MIYFLIKNTIIPYIPEELATLKELRLENKKRYQREYYLKKTKPKRKRKTITI